MNNDYLNEIDYPEYNIHNNINNCRNTCLISNEKCVDHFYADHLKADNISESEDYKIDSISNKQPFKPIKPIFSTINNKIEQDSDSKIHQVKRKSNCNQRAKRRVILGHKKSNSNSSINKLNKSKFMNINKKEVKEDITFLKKKKYRE